MTATCLQCDWPVTPSPLQHKFTTGQQTYSGDLHLAASNFLVGAGNWRSCYQVRECSYTVHIPSALLLGWCVHQTPVKELGVLIVFSIQLRNNFDDTGSQGFVFTERTGTSHLDKVH